MVNASAGNDGPQAVSSAQAVAPPRDRHIDRHISSWARLAGSSTSGVMEICLFHPFDTVGKRLMSYQQPVFKPGRSFAEVRTIINSVVYREAADAPPGVKFRSLFQGVEAAMGKLPAYLVGTFYSTLGVSRGVFVFVAVCGCMGGQGWVVRAQYIFGVNSPCKNTVLRSI